ncbi:MAG: RnfH family protein [Pseudomonadota bacterium]
MSDETGSAISVEVAFALPDRQALLPLTIPPGTTVAKAIALSRITERFPETDFAVLAVGVWGREVMRDHCLQDGDRLEIYRPLRMDPKEARRRLAESGGTMSGTVNTEASKSH